MKSSPIDNLTNGAMQEARVRSGRSHREGRLKGLAMATLSWAILGWLLFTIAHRLLSGRFALWTIAGLAPPIVFAVIPVVLLFAGAFVPGRRIALAVLSASALFIAWPFTGLNLAAFNGGEGATGGRAVTVVTLNTDYWSQDRGDAMWSDYRDRGEMFAYLRSLDADILMLQEHMLREGNDIIPITDLGDVKEAFPEYDVVAEGTLITLSRMPIVGHGTVASVDQPQLQFPAPYGLRVDISVGDQTLSTYNVHMPVQLLIEASPLSRRFYSEIQKRHDRRAEEYRALTQSVRDNQNPSFIAGDFNTSPAMGDNRELLEITTDAAMSTTMWYPASWREGGHLPTLWRTDWALTRGEVGVLAYEFLSSEGNSDHKAQMLTLRVG
jgi:endonuclease/exonuclease/phosphatase family metal-dependent hydrolase